MSRVFLGDWTRRGRNDDNGNASDFVDDLAFETLMMISLLKPLILLVVDDDYC